MMRLREASGEINRAKSVFLWTWIDLENPDPEAGGMWLEIPKVAARQIIAHCREHNIEEIDAHIEKGNLMIEAHSAEVVEEGEEPAAAEEEEEACVECEKTCGPDCDCACHEESEE